MKSSTLSAAMIGVVCLLLFTQAASAQDVPRESGVDGYTSIEYDPDTNIVTAYSETDVTDYYLIPDYQAFVSMDIQNDSGTVLIYGSAYDYEGFGYASIILEVAGDPATTYTAQAGHQLRLNLFDDYSESTFPYTHVYDYYDNYFFGYYESFNIYEPFYYFFQNRGYNPRTRRRKAIILGRTHDFASVTTPRAYPVNLQYQSVSSEADGTLHLTYTFESSTGNLADISRCTMGEIVKYPGSGNVCISFHRV